LNVKGIQQLFTVSSQGILSQSFLLFNYVNVNAFSQGTLNYLGMRCMPFILFLVQFEVFEPLAQSNVTIFLYRLVQCISITLKIFMK